MVSVNERILFYIAFGVLGFSIGVFIYNFIWGMLYALSPAQIATIYNIKKYNEDFLHCQYKGSCKMWININNNNNTWIIDYCCEDYNITDILNCHIVNRDLINKGIIINEWYWKRFIISKFVASSCSLLSILCILFGIFNYICCIR